MTKFVLVLGMHRSGTSMVANILMEAGYYAGEVDDLLPPSPTNVNGYFERKDVMAANDLILQICGGDWLTPPSKDCIETIQINAHLQMIINKLSSHEKIILKDPRMCLTLPVWKEVLGYEVKIILTYRDTDAIVQSLQRRDNLPAETSSAITKVYYERAIEYSNEYPVFSLNYEDLLLTTRDQALTSLAEFLGTDQNLVELASKIIDPSLDHSANQQGNDQPAWPEEVMALVQQADLAVGEGDFSGAIEAINLSLEIEPADGWLITTLGNLQYQSGDVEAAKQSFVKATRLCPRFAPGFKQLAHLLIELEDIEGAEIALEAAISLDPHDSSMQDLRISLAKDVEPDPIPIMNAPRATLPHILHHHTPKGHPEATLELAPSKIVPEDIRICERLIEAFNTAFEYEQSEVEPEKRPNDGVWEAIKHEFHGGLYKALFEKNAAKTADLITNGFRQSFSMGLGPGQAIFNAAKDPKTGASISTLILDRMFAFGEALGLVTYENPEQGKWGENIYGDFDLLMSDMEKLLKIKLTFPSIMGNFGVLSGKQIINVRTPDNLYTSWRIRQLLECRKDMRVCEIGAGFGGNAYYFHQYGIERYNLIDLPIINVLQGYFLIKTCGADQVQLFGEDDTGQPLVVSPYWEFFTLPDNHFDLVWNQDSLPEIQYDRAMEYIREIPRLTTEYFLSINQECENTGGRADLHQLVVMNLTDEVPAYQRISRFPYWLRKGYVEELYRVNK